jgi:hypothetical protein
MALITLEDLPQSDELDRRASCRSWVARVLALGQPISWVRPLGTAESSTIRPVSSAARRYSRTRSVL